MCKNVKTKNNNCAFLPADSIIMHRFAMKPPLKVNWRPTSCKSVGKTCIILLAIYDFGSSVWETILMISKTNNKTHEFKSFFERICLSVCRFSAPNALRKSYWRLQCERPNLGARF